MTPDSDPDEYPTPLTLFCWGAVGVVVGVLLVTAAIQLLEVWL